MHIQFLFLFDKDKANNSEEARHHVTSYLSEEGFIGSGRWNCGLCDWFVIGGRFSGQLTIKHLNQERYAKLLMQFEKKYSWNITKRSPREKRKQQFTKLFIKHFPTFTGETPEWRNDYAPNGYEDDAMILDKQLYDSLIKHYEGDTQSEYHCVEEFEDVEESFIGNKWIVVVDYHR